MCPGNLRLSVLVQQIVLVLASFLEHCPGNGSGYLLSALLSFLGHCSEGILPHVYCLGDLRLSEIPSSDIV